jgi:hypothetical protein
MRDNDSLYYTERAFTVKHLRAPVRGSALEAGMQIGPPCFLTPLRAYALAIPVRAV